MCLQEVAKAEGGLEGDQDGFGGVLRQRKRTADADEPQSQAVGEEDATQKVLDDYFGADEAQLGEGERFLKKFIANKAGLTPMLAGSCWGPVQACSPDQTNGQNSPTCHQFLAAAIPVEVQMAEKCMMQWPIRLDSCLPHPRLASLQGWLEQEGGGRQGYGTDDEEDEEYIERAERFESAYNHRFEARALPEPLHDMPCMGWSRSWLCCISALLDANCVACVPHCARDDHCWCLQGWVGADMLFNTPTAPAWCGAQDNRRQKGQLTFVQEECSFVKPCHFLLAPSSERRLCKQEPGGASMVTYPRHLEGGVRKADSRRRAQREAATQRRAADAAAEEEQVKRLKSAKRREIDERYAPPMGATARLQSEPCQPGAA